MFAIAISYESLPPYVNLTQFGYIAWDSFFSAVHYGRKVSVMTRTAAGDAVRVEYDGKDFNFSRY